MGDLIIAWGRVAVFGGAFLFLVFSFLGKARLQSRSMSIGKAIMLQTIAIMCYEGLFSFIHWLYFGGFVVGFAWIIVLDSNWIVVVEKLIWKLSETLHFVPLKCRFLLQERQHARPK